MNTICVLQPGKRCWEKRRQTAGGKDQLKVSNDSVQLCQDSWHALCQISMLQAAREESQSGKRLIAQAWGPEFKAQHPPKSQALQCACLQPYSWGEEDKRPQLLLSRQSVSSRFGERLSQKVGREQLRRTLMSTSEHGWTHPYTCMYTHIHQKKPKKPML